MDNTQSPFGSLPLELKLETLESVIPEYTLPEKIRANDAIVARAERDQVPRLVLSCQMIRGIIKDMRRIIAVSHDSRVLFTFDLKRDTLLVRNMRLPRFEVGGKAEMLPIRRIITRINTPTIPTGVQPTEHQLRFISDEPWQNLTFATSLPILAKLPLVEELTVICRYLPLNWQIDSFQVLGPDIVGKRTDEENWGLSRAYNYPKEYQAANYFLRMGIAPDTGIRWKLPFRHGLPIDMISDDEDISINFPGQSCIPYIGFHGYSKGARSLGGKWAGFLYNPVTETVKFRPLNWTEVSAHYRSRIQPHFIAKV